MTGSDVEQDVLEEEKKIVCPNCGHHNSPGVDKCSNCGHPRNKGEWKQVVDEKKKKKSSKRKKAGTESSKESSLRDWFGRKGAKGKKKGWVDCNAPDGKGGYKSCGRGSGEKRKKYPACRPTPSACKERGKGKSWGKKSAKQRKRKGRSKRRNEGMSLTSEFVLNLIEQQVQEALNDQIMYEHYILEDATYEDGSPLEEDFEFFEVLSEDELEEAVYQGKTVKLNKPTRGDVKKFKVYVNSGRKDAKGRVIAKKVNFGHGGSSARKKGEKTMRIRKSNPKARRNFRKRHNCATPGPKTKARYWSCKKW